ncbi:MAG: AI-2E family transporter [Candidatus Methylopumilus sp.]|jgi:predicted PurR-regulated permease PerM|nr:AI-2E family transporter [Candidatus Methylopumilus sp.]
MNNIKLSSFIAIFALISLVLILHMAPTLLIGMLIYLLTKRLGDKLSLSMPEKLARILAAALITTVLIGAFVSAVMFLSNTLSNEQNLAGLAAKLGESVNDIKNDLPPTLLSYLPESMLSLNGSVSDLIKEHTRELGVAGKESLHTFAHILIAVVVALMLSMSSFAALAKSQPFAKAMRERIQLLGKAFENIVFAQIKISAINTLLTGIFLLIVLPYFGVNLPYNKTLVIVTFFAGLLPVIGNLISNTIITVISIGVSLKVAIAALVFLVGIHKLEYFINAKIIGIKINAAAWELLLALLVMESLFGITGLLIAPILYAYIKSELLLAKLI